jgi:hypothetical protein
MIFLRDRDNERLLRLFKSYFSLMEKKLYWRASAFLEATLRFIATTAPLDISYDIELYGAMEFSVPAREHWTSVKLRSLAAAELSRRSGSSSR